MAYCILRLSSVACTIDPNWCQQDLAVMATRAVEVIYGGQATQTVVDGNGDDDDDDVLHDGRLAAGFHVRCFPAPTFAFCFPLLHHVLKDGGVVVDKKEEILDKALAIVSAHSQLRCNDELTDSIDEVGLIFC